MTRRRIVNEADAFTLGLFPKPPSEVSTSLPATSKPLSIRLNPLWQRRRLISLLTSAPLRRLPVNVLNLRSTLAWVLNWITATRPPDGDTSKKRTRVWRKFNKRVQLRRLAHPDESTMKVVSIGIGHSSPVTKTKSMINKNIVSSQYIFQ